THTPPAIPPMSAPWLLLLELGVGDGTMTIVARMVVVYNAPSGEVDLREFVYIEVDVVERVGSGETSFWLEGGVAVMVTTGGSQVVPGPGGGGETVMGGCGG
ncbi:hypothetical protein BC826DRAFT_1047843, partial [Russula brevipes]